LTAKLNGKHQWFLHICNFHPFQIVGEEEDCQSEDDYTVFPVKSSGFTEERFTKVYDIQRELDTSAHFPGKSDLNKTLPPESPGELLVGNEIALPAKEAEACLEEAEEFQPETTVEQPSTEDVEILPEQGNVMPAITLEDDDVPLLDFGEPKDGNNKRGPQKTDIEMPDGCDQQDEEVLGEVVEDASVRRSERSRRAPGRFHYPQLGKPLISFAQNLLDSFNQTLSIFSEYENKELVSV